MHNTKNRFSRKMLTLTLGLSIAFTGAVAMTPATTHAATTTSYIGTYTPDFFMTTPYPSAATTGASTTTPDASTTATDTLTTATDSVEVSSTLATKIANTGKKYLGVRYLFGAASGRTDAFDCSSFTQYIFKKNGISLPRSSRQQAKAGKYVSRSNLQPGDLIFSDTNRDGVINHVSLYIGNGKLLHTYAVGIGVTISTFKGSAWDRNYVTARRYF